MEKQKRNINIGVTGHMDVKNPEDTLKRIKDFFGIIKNDYPDSHITMLSAIAEGADLLFVKGGFSVFPNAELTAVLPFAKEKYEKDFKNELNDFEYYYDKACMKKDMSEENEQKSNEDGYEQASLYIAEHSDILLAVWDGKLLKNGIAQGGTCDIVSKIIKEKDLPEKILVHLVTERNKVYSSEYTYINEKAGDLSLISYKNGQITSLKNIEKSIKELIN